MRFLSYCLIKIHRKFTSAYLICDKASLTPGLELDSFKPLPERSIFKCISRLNDLLFGGDDRGFVQDGVEAYLMAPVQETLVICRQWVSFLLLSVVHGLSVLSSVSGIGGERNVPNGLPPCGECCVVVDPGKHHDHA